MESCVFSLLLLSRLRCCHMEYSRLHCRSPFLLSTVELHADDCDWRTWLTLHVFSARYEEATEIGFDQALFVQIFCLPELPPCRPPTYDLPYFLPL